MNGANVLWMAGRYLASRRNPHAAFINWASFAGLTAGVVLLTVVASVMNGFDRELRTRLLGVVPHVLAVPPGGAWDTPPGASPATPPEVLSSRRFFAGSAVVGVRGSVQPLLLYGVDSTAPAGLDLGRVGHREMAVSILAELVALRSVTPRVAEPAEERGPVSVGPERSEAGSAEVSDPVCGMMVIPTQARFRVEYRGQRYWFCAAGCETAFRHRPDRYLSSGE